MSMNLVLVVGILLLCLNSVGAKKRVMSWLCLEFCEETEDDVAMDMKQIERYKDVFSAVSFEKYTLGPNCTLLDNELIPVSDDIQALGLEAWPLLSSFPHYPEFIDWMREVFASPQVFIDQCVSEAAKYGYHGYNLDWEPTDDCTEQDGNDYATFIQTFAQGLHQNGLQLSVDYAGWSPIWNLTAIAESEADYIISMSTYTSNDDSFTNSLNKLTAAVDLGRAGVGLETVNATDGTRISLDRVKWRFDQMTAAGVQEVDLWRSPVPPLWMPIIAEWALGGEDGNNV